MVLVPVIFPFRTVIKQPLTLCHSMIRRLVLISVFLSLQFKAFAAPLPLEDVKKVLDDLLLQVESQSVSEAEAIQEHVPQTRSRLNSRQDMHISIGPVQRRLLDITTRTFVEIAHDADDICKGPIFLRNQRVILSHASLPSSGLDLFDCSSWKCGRVSQSPGRVSSSHSEPIENDSLF